MALIAIGLLTIDGRAVAAAARDDSRLTPADRRDCALADELSFTVSARHFSLCNQT